MIDGGAVSTPKSKNFEVFGPSKQTIRQRNSVIEGRKRLTVEQVKDLAVAVIRGKEKYLAPASVQ